MAPIQRVEVEGFKAIRSLAIEPTAINVITGRNNTGKTSLLEAMQLAINPVTIEQFGSSIDTLVNAEFERASIRCEMKQEDREVTISHPDAQQARDILTDAVTGTVEKLISQLSETTRSDAPPRRLLENELPGIIANAFDEETVSQAVDRIVMISVAGSDYAYIHPTGGVSDFFETVAQEIDQRVMDEYREEPNPTSIPLNFSFGLEGYLASPRILGDPPAHNEAITSLDLAEIAQQPDSENGEADAVKIDDIEEFLIDHGIVENLRNFDVDYLVFEDADGEKYSVPYDFMGEGFRGIVGILWQLLDDDVDETVVLLEEPGGRMHPGYIRELVYFLVDVAQTTDVQLFITTHNNDFVTDFFSENLTDTERSFLQSEFTLIQLQAETADVMGYDEAEANLKDVHLDLRGL